MLQVLKNRNFYAVLVSVVLSVVFVAALASASTTISTNISTGGTLTVSGASTLTGITTHSQQVVLYNSASNPTSATAGGIFYDSTNRVVKLYNGSDWLTVASSTDADGGLILQNTNAIRFNSVASGYMALGTTTAPLLYPSAASGHAVLHVSATTTNSIPLVITGVAGQTSDLIDLYNASLSEVFAVDLSGAASTTRLTLSGSFWVNGYATTTGSSGNFATEGTLTVTGASTQTGTVSVGGGYAAGSGSGITVGTDGKLQINSDLEVNGYATTTASNGNLRIAGSFGVGTSTPSLSAQLGVNGDVHIGGTGTTTVSLNTSAVTARGTCIQMKATDNDVVRIYVNNANALVVEAGACSGGGSL